MQNYKIKVANEAESKEAQELLFALGYGWKNSKNQELCILPMKILFATINGGLARTNSANAYDFDNGESQEITLPQLRDLVVLHRNDVGDATHISEDGEMYHIANDVFVWQDGKWAQSSVLTPELKPIKEAKNQMTWQDALRAVADGKEVEALDSEGWSSIEEWELGHFKNAKDYRLTPQRKTLNGNFTKEELLKIVGEME